MKSAYELLSKYLDGIQPSTAIVLGSGLGIELDSTYWQLTSEKIPGFISPTVVGHSGSVTAGVFVQTEVLLMKGRVHYYEGFPKHRVTFQVRLMYELGIRNIIIVSAAGGIRKTLNPGSIMLVEDHICAHGIAATFQARQVYDLSWRERVRSAYNKSPVSSGVYVWTIGPSYETPAEITAFERRGGDAVGMSMVPEAMEASALNMYVFAAAVITNSAAGLGEEELSHESVLNAAIEARVDLTNLLSEAVAQAPNH